MARRATSTHGLITRMLLVRTSSSVPVPVRSGYVTASVMVTTSIGNARRGGHRKPPRPADGKERPADALLGGSTADRGRGDVVLAEEQHRRCTGVVDRQLAVHLVPNHQGGNVDRPPVEAGRRQVCREGAQAGSGDVDGQERSDLIDDHDLAGCRRNGGYQKADVEQIGTDLFRHVHGDGEIHVMLRGYRDVPAWIAGARRPQRIGFAGEGCGSVVAQRDALTLGGHRHRRRTWIQDPDGDGCCLARVQRYRSGGNGDRNRARTSRIGTRRACGDTIRNEQDACSDCQDTRQPPPRSFDVRLLLRLSCNSGLRCTSAFRCTFPMQSHSRSRSDR